MICNKCDLDKDVTRFPLKHNKSGTASQNPLDRRRVCYQCEYDDRPRPIKLTALERFNTKWVVDFDGCHIWTKGTDQGGYGYFFANGKTVHAHRWLFKEAHGYLPPMVCHSCDKPACVREQCLFPGTHQDNMDDMWRKGRKPVGEKSGTAKFTDKEIDEIRDGYATGLVSYSMLAELYGISISHIARIAHNKTR